MPPKVGVLCPTLGGIFLRVEIHRNVLPTHTIPGMPPVHRYWPLLD
jgi:hypothetical protein